MSTIVKEAAPKARPAQRFPATVGRFDDPADRTAIDGLVRWVEDRYRADLQERPSKHVYIRTLPAAAVEPVDRLRDSPVIRALIARHVPAGSVIAPMTPAISTSGIRGWTLFSRRKRLHRNPTATCGGVRGLLEYSIAAFTT